MRYWISTLVLAWTVAVSAQDAPDFKSIPGVGPTGKPVKLHTGFKFTEGPAADAQGNLYFVDIPNNRILKSDAQGKLSTLLEDSKASNGLMVDFKGRLLVCQGGKSRVIAIDVKDKNITVIADKCDDGKSLGAPNDLVIDRQGGVYITNAGQSVFYAAPDGKVTRIINNLARPNGISLSPNEMTLYVLPSGSADVMAYPVISPGKIGEGKVLCKLIADPKRKDRIGGDGMAVDTQGNLYLTRPSMKLIQVVSPKGDILGFLSLPEEPANCKFGDPDMKTLYVTATSSVYKIPMEAKGHRFAVIQAGKPLPETWDYVAPMKKVAAKFKGNEGVVLHVGGSMTIANPYGEWARSGKGKTPEDEAILKWMHAGSKDKKMDGWWLCRTELEHYRTYTTESGLQSGMLLKGGNRGLPTLEKMLTDFKPRMVTFECGIYDVENKVPIERYEKEMGQALDIVLAHGAIPIINTIPPFRADMKRMYAFNDVLRKLCAERGTPLLDLEREILWRRPGDWFDTLADRIHLTARPGRGFGSLGAQVSAVEKAGVLVTAVTPDSPAAKAGLQKGDQIVKLSFEVPAGKPAKTAKKGEKPALKSVEEKIESAQKFSQTVESRRRGDKLTLGILRDGKEQSLTAFADEYPSYDTSPDNLRQHGYVLRGWLTVRKIAEIKRNVLDNP